ncbi:hypothetical protein [Halothermothrix orenii]|uniref:Uncharacterized protein n=1 Tax=Halothermothrix orenii (strain H 168 / OCM 544 / DSM 9562) TaxID=373903 RepID=B8CXV0_HALOH|nr:hypothetical protein [Halothermothrix orenii]ACL70119.1 hypothetical protein Hore_13670 [Halothermothrix orenii H 168]
MKKTFYIIILIVLISSMVLYYINYVNNYEVTEAKELNDKMIKIITEDINNKDKIVLDLNKMTKFNWNKLYIVGPYTDPKIFCSKKGVKWSNSIITTIKYDDGVYLLLFVQDKKVIKYLDFSRRYGSFPEGEYDKGNSLFEITKNKDYIDINHLKEIK